MPSDLEYVLTGLVTLIVLVTVALLVIRHFWHAMLSPKPEKTEAKPERKMWFLLKGPRCDYYGCMNRPNEIKCVFCGAPLKAEAT